MQGNEYQQQQPGFWPPHTVSYALSSEFEPSEPAANHENRRVKAGSCANFLAFVDILISGVCFVVFTLYAIYVLPYVVVLPFVYAGSITASILIIRTQPNKKWVAVFWVLWNVFRVLVDMAAPIVSWRLWILMYSGHRSSGSDSDGLGMVITLIYWGILEPILLCIYITFLVYFIRYWRAFNIPMHETGMDELRPPSHTVPGQHSANAKQLPPR